MVSLSCYILYMDLKLLGVTNVQKDGAESEQDRANCFSHCIKFNPSSFSGTKTFLKVSSE